MLGCDQMSSLHQKENHQGACKEKEMFLSRTAKKKTSGEAEQKCADTDVPLTQVPHLLIGQCLQLHFERPVCTLSSTV